MHERGIDKQNGKPLRCGREPQRELREEQARPQQVAERPVVVKTPGNAGRAKGPDFWRVPGRDQQSGDWLMPISSYFMTERSRKELYLLAKTATLSASRPMSDEAVVS